LFLESLAQELRK